MDSKFVQFLPPDFVADCQFLMELGYFNSIAETCKALVENIKGKKREEPGPKARILAFHRSEEEAQQPREKPLSIPMLESLGYEVLCYRVYKHRSGDNVTAMVRKNDVFYDYNFMFWKDSGEKTEFRTIPQDLLKCEYTLYGPRTGRIVPPEVALPILTKASGCTAFESEPRRT